MSKYYKKELPTDYEFNKIKNETVIKDIYKELYNHYQDLMEDYTELFYDYSKLKERIDKAIEYINDNIAVCAFNNKELPHWEFDDNNMQDLLKILGGEE